MNQKYKGQLTLGLCRTSPDHILKEEIQKKGGKYGPLVWFFERKKSLPFYLYANGPWSWVKHSLYLVPTQHLNWLFFDSDLL